MVVAGEDSADFIGGKYPQREMADLLLKGK
jgi:hypothetical protein